MWPAMQGFDRTGLVLSLASSALGLGVAVAVFVLVIVWRSRVHQYLRPALKLALLVLALELPSLVTILPHLDLSATVAGLPREALRIASMLFPAFLIGGMLLGFLYSCRQVPVAILIEPARCPFPLFLQRGRSGLLARLDRTLLRG